VAIPQCCGAGSINPYVVPFHHIAASASPADTHPEEVVARDHVAFARQSPSYYIALSTIGDPYALHPVGYGGRSRDVGADVVPYYQVVAAADGYSNGSLAGDDVTLPNAASPDNIVSSAASNHDAGAVAPRRRTAVIGANEVSYHLVRVGTLSGK